MKLAMQRQGTKQIEGMVEKVANEKGLLKKKQVSDEWYRRFLERQPQLWLRKGDRAAMAHLDALKDREALGNYYLMDKPSQIYNVDESGVPLDHWPPYVLTKVKKGQVWFVRKQDTNNCNWVYKCVRTSYTSFHCL